MFKSKAVFFLGSVEMPHLFDNNCCNGVGAHSDKVNIVGFLIVLEVEVVFSLVL